MSRLGTKSESFLNFIHFYAFIHFIQHLEGGKKYESAKGKTEALVGKVCKSE